MNRKTTTKQPGNPNLRTPKFLASEKMMEAQALLMEAQALLRGAA